jgi:glycosyltransferase involved in cell wall biosynthesis
MHGTRSGLPPLAPGCRITVVIPARNESAFIGPTLSALVDQRDLAGRPVPRNFFEIIVFANNCSDDTATVARNVALGAPQRHIHVVEERAATGLAHVGTARKYVMDLAADRFLSAGMPSGIIASLDSDTLADNHWIAWIAREMRDRDAVAGHVRIAEVDQERLLAPVRLLYARELAYRRILAEIDSLIDPRPEDPAPRHGSLVGASFAVSAQCYRAAGGLPPLRRLEDVEFSLALRRIDARVRHSPLVRSTTSARVAARVDGGFGTFIADLHDCARRGDSFTVEHPLRSIEDSESRAALRRIWQHRRHAGDIEALAAIYNLAPAEWLPSIDRALPFGTVYERLAKRAEPTRRIHAPVRVETAIDVLRGAVVDRKLGHIVAVDEDAVATLDAG